MIHSHTTIERYYQDIASILQSKMIPLSLTEIESLPPGELDIHIIMIAQKVKEDAERRG